MAILRWEFRTVLVPLKEDVEEKATATVEEKEWWRWYRPTFTDESGQAFEQVKLLGFMGWELFSVVPLTTGRSGEWAEGGWGCSFTSALLYHLKRPLGSGPDTGDES
jgi:hypothetical protein